jgi:uncharacterized damage-inducible protein DinB
MHDQVVPLHNILKINTGLFTNCLDGIDDRHAAQRPNERTNNIVFIAAHLVEARYFLATQLQVAAPMPFDGKLSGAKTIADIDDFPSLGEVTASWDEISDKLSSRFETLTSEELGNTSEQTFPGDDRTMLGAIAFLLQHEAYHIGQLAFIRKFLDHQPMSYDFT